MKVETRPFYSLKDYFLERYGRRVQKVTVALPFTCPNRDGTKAVGGCTFCYDGSKPTLIDPRVPLRDQIREGMERARRKYGEDIYFFVYYQSYTNTYADLETLKRVYDTALEFEGVVGIDVGARPDCAPEEVLDLLASYAERGLEVWVEYGLQSANFETLKRINRAHGVSDFVDAVLRTKRRPLKVCAHVILGLPGETEEDFLETAKLIASLPVDGVKIHPLHVIRGTAMAEQFRRGEFGLLTFEEYVRACADFIEIIPENVVVHRVTGEVDESLLIAPDYCSPRMKNRVLTAVERELRKRGTRQGSNRRALNRGL
ncbi:MAG: TIGR01212 family radical SAM protein [Aquificota bacterium]|nr:TIGR01212 family radical SAM protein [Aquificota bacterium]